jgi:chromosome partitioning protein
MSKIITVCNQKGGVGKTTTAINIASYVAMSSRKTLLIDVDPQANATSGLGVEKNSVNESTYECLLGQADLEKIILPTEVENLFLAPSNIRLTGAEIELVKESDREHKLKHALELIKEKYSYIFIDTPPSLGLLTLNALTAADRLIIPLQCEYYSLEGISQLINTINLVKESLNPKLEIEGVILTMADFRTKLADEVIKEVKSHFGNKVYETVVPRNIKIAEAPGYGKSIFLYEPSSSGALRYKELAEEFLRNTQGLSGCALDRSVNAQDEPRGEFLKEEKRSLDQSVSGSGQTLGQEGDVSREAQQEKSTQ